MPDPLQRVLRLRQRMVEQVRLGLAACLKAEAERLAVVTDLEARVQRDRQEANILMNDDPWLATIAARGRTALQLRHAAARQALEQAAAATADARDHIAAARADAEGVQTLITNRRDAEIARQEQEAQHALADLVLALRRGRAAEKPD